MSVAARIDELLRQKVGDDGKTWKPADLARACGRPAAWLNKRIGKGPLTKKQKMTIEDLELIAKGLGVETCDLFPSSFSYDLRKMTIFEFFEKIVGRELEKRLAQLEAPADPAREPR